MYFEVDRKTGFATGTDRKIRIYDEDGKSIFYFWDAHKLPFAFNLPKGKYFTLNKISKQSQPRKYKLPQLPPRERYGVIPDDVEFVYHKNPNKASIVREKKLVIMDPSIRDLSRPQRVAVKLHELAHYLYATEYYCDLYAAREMLRLGFNPSQILNSIDATLSDDPRTFVNRKWEMLADMEKA